MMRLQVGRFACDSRGRPRRIACQCEGGEDVSGARDTERFAMALIRMARPMSARKVEVKLAATHHVAHC